MTYQISQACIIVREFEPGLGLKEAREMVDLAAEILGLERGMGNYFHETAKVAALAVKLGKNPSLFRFIEDVESLAKTLACSFNLTYANDTLTAEFAAYLHYDLKMSKTI